ncbi:MAG: hypothetical protein R3C56_15310 [Pirellulaceae bacterium]
MNKNGVIAVMPTEWSVRDWLSVVSKSGRESAKFNGFDKIKATLVAWHGCKMSRGYWAIQRFEASPPSNVISVFTPNHARLS